MDLKGPKFQMLTGMGLIAVGLLGLLVGLLFPDWQFFSYRNKGPQILATFGTGIGLYWYGSARQKQGR